MRYSVSFILDTLFTLFISFILSFVLLSFFIARIYAIAYSALIALLVTAVVFKFRSDKNKKTHLKKQDERLCNSVIDQLNFMAKSSVTKLFERAISNKGNTYRVKRSGILVVEDDNLLVLKFGFEPVTKTDVVKAYNAKEKGGKALIYSESFSAEIIEFASRFNGEVALLDKVDTFEFLSQNDAIPEITVSPKPKRKFRFYLSEFLKVKKAKKYLAFGIMFLAFSFLTVYKLYYVVFGCSLLIVALLCRLYGEKTTN